MAIKDGFCRTDSDGLVYKREDTEWGIHPSEDDGCGYLVPKANAIPVSEEEWYEN